MADFLPSPFKFNNVELAYVNKGFVLDFFHIPSAKSVSFKAFLTDFQDKFESSWNSENVYGRMDPIQTFQGTRRSISLSWVVVASSLGEAKQNLQRATLLFSMLYPSYNENNDVSIISAAPLFRLSFANLIRDYSSAGDVGDHSDAEETDTTNQPGLGTAGINGLVGTVGGFNYSPNLEAGFYDPPGADSGKLFPKEINLSCEYTVIHTHPLGWNNSKEFRNPNFPYGQPIQELGKKDTGVNESRLGGTDQHNASKQNQILGSKKK
jgi:hypothetical protein